MQNQRQERNLARTEGRLGYQQAPNAVRVVRFEEGPPARDDGRNLRWDAAGPGGRGGQGKGSRGKGGGPSASSSGRYGHGQGHGGSELSSY